MANSVNIAAVSEDALDLKNMLDGVLSRVEAIFESYGVPLPKRRYWTMGQPAVDCEQLVVWMTQLYLGPPGDPASRPLRCNVPRSASLSISVSRAVPTVGTNGRPPEAKSIEISSQLSAVDIWVLMQSLNALDQWDETGYGVGVIGTAEVGSPEGGFLTTTMQVTMAVP